MKDSPVARPATSLTEGRSRREHPVVQQPRDMTHPPQVEVSSPHARVGRRRLLAVAETLTARDLAILETVSRFRVVSGDQLRRLHFHTIRTHRGGIRVCNRSLQRLVTAGALHRLERRVGGVRAGSAGAVYTITPVGIRLRAHSRGTLEAGSGRTPHEPGLAFVNHTLAVADTYVRILEADRAGTIELLTFDPEPDCWRAHPTGLGATAIVKPDAYVAVAAGEFEHCAFLEVDLATEGRAAIARKLRAYIAFHASGREQAARGVFPRVLWLTPSKQRAQAIAALIETLPQKARRLFLTTTADKVLDALTDEGDAS